MIHSPHPFAVRWDHGIYSLVCVYEGHERLGNLEGNERIVLSFFDAVSRWGSLSLGIISISESELLEPRVVV